jgi:RNA polymerase sigma factor (sigma-70 family)
MAVREAIKQLPPRQREAVVLRYFLGFTVNEAAAAMKVSAGALRSLTHRAGQQLEQDLRSPTDEVNHAH